MLSNKYIFLEKKRSYPNIAIIGIFIFVPMFILGCSSGIDHKAETTLSDGAAQEIEDYINAHLDIVESMPGHPGSEALYKHVISCWRYDTGASESAISWRLATMLPDSPLGLYALSQLITDAEVKSSETQYTQYLHDMVAIYPGSRAASFTFAQLLKDMDESEAQAACQEAITQYGDGRLGVFARIRLADYLDEKGEPDKAAEQRLLAWIADPKRGLQVFDKLYLYWNAHDAWYWAVLFPQSLLEDSAINALKFRALSELRRFDHIPHVIAAQSNEDHTYSHFVKQLRKSGSFVNQGRFNDAIHALQQTLELLPNAGLQKIESTDYGLAIFLLEMLPGKNEPSIESRELWTAQAQFRHLQNEGLSFVKKGIDSYSEALGDYQRLAVAKVYRKRGQSREAVKWLEEQVLRKSVSPKLRFEMATLISDIYCQDLNTPQESIRIFLACAELENNPEYTFQAAFHLYKMNAYQEADALLITLLAKDQSALGERRPDILYLSGLCRFQFGNTSQAEGVINNLLLEYPNHVLAPKALWLLVNQRIVLKGVGEARELLERIKSDYGNSSEARKATYYLERLEEKK